MQAERRRKKKKIVLCECGQGGQVYPEWGREARSTLSLNAGRESSSTPGVRARRPGLPGVWAGRPGLTLGSGKGGQVYPRCKQGGHVYPWVQVRAGRPGLPQSPGREARSTPSATTVREAMSTPGLRAGN